MMSAAFSARVARHLTPFENAQNVGVILVSLALFMQGTTLG